MKTKILLALLIFSSINNYTFSQDLKMCAYRDYLTEAEIQKACGFNSYMSNQKAEQVVDNILSNVGLFRNFIIKECPDISNAVAATVKSSLGSFERYIIYDKAFLDRVSGVTGTDWSAISIMAHEIGHHLNGHTLTEGIGNHQAELQADEFSGFVLAKMGASLEQSLGAIKQYGNVTSTNSHPNKNLRIKSISEGWNKANKVNNGNLKITNNSNIDLYEYDEKQMKYFLNKGNQEYEKKNYSQAAPYFVKAFQYSAGLEKLYLYYAAAIYVNANDYDNAQKYYLLILKNGIHSLERNQQQEIYKNIALIYVHQDKKEDALNFLKVAQRENPNDVNLLLTEANLQYKLGNTFEFKRLVEKASQKDPNNAELFYNLGVISSESNDFLSAKNYYEKAIKLDPNYINAYINISALILQGEAEIISEMNTLGSSKADDKRYDVLRDQRLGLYRSVVPYLEKAIQIDKSNRSAINTLMNIYSILGETREYNRLKKM